jgi:hypothetical protein
MIVIIMLIYIVSFEFQLPAYIVIHNQCSNTKLISPVYFSNGAVCSELPDQQIDIGTKVRTGFRIDTIENKFEGALLFKLKRHVESYDQYNTDTLTAEINMNEATDVHMVVAWEVKNTKPFAYVTLVEHTKVTWIEGKLIRLYYENHGRLKEYDDTISETWCIDDNMILKTSFSAGYLKGILELNISISEEEKDDYAMRPFHINPKR